MELLKSGSTFDNLNRRIINANFTELAAAATGAPTMEVIPPGKFFYENVREIIRSNFALLEAADTVPGIVVVPYGMAWIQAAINIVNDNFQAVYDTQNP